MKTTCIINNYNYAQYVEAAIQSVLDQTVAFDEIVVVDDGSTDNSLELISASIKNCQNAKLIAKKNQGQLSCFNEGFKASSGDLIFFLDSDDLYMPNYLETTLHFYHQTGECDFLFCSVQEFGKSNSIKNYIQNYCEKTGDVGFSLVRTFYDKDWIGSVTSALSMKRAILKKILPLPFLEEWRTQADNCLVYGSSLVGARKYFIAKPLVKYRVHENNNWYGKVHTKSYKYKILLAIDKLIPFILKRNYLPMELFDLIVPEFKSIPSPNYHDLKRYIDILNTSNFGYKHKRKIIRKLNRVYLKCLKKRVTLCVKEKIKDLKIFETKTKLLKKQ